MTEETEIGGVEGARVRSGTPICASDKSLTFATRPTNRTGKIAPWPEDWTTGTARRGNPRGGPLSGPRIPGGLQGPFSPEF